MKILYVSSHDLVGQQFNGYLLLNAMRKMDIDARMYVHHSQVDRPDVVYHPDSRNAIFLNDTLSRVEKGFSFHGILPTHSVDIMKNSFYEEADIVHLQLIHASQFFSLLSLPSMGFRKKLAPIRGVRDSFIGVADPRRRLRVGCKGRVGYSLPRFKVVGSTSKPSSDELEGR